MIFVSKYIIYEISKSTLLLFISWSSQTHQWQNIKGIVPDKYSGMAIAQPTIAIEQLQITDQTDEEGKFMLENVPLGLHAIYVLIIAQRMLT